MKPADAPLGELHAHLFQRLARACAHANDPFRTPSLGTGATSHCAVRTVVLREVHPKERRLVCFTDVRSSKVQHLHKHPTANWLFYEAGDKTQLRASGKVTIHFQNQLARRFWEKVPAVSRANYCTIAAPGAEIASPELALPEELRGHRPTTDNTAAGWSNFAVLITTVGQLDWLWLNAGGHRRAVFAWSGRGWKGHWAAP